MYYIGESQERKKVFIIEEVEAFLDPSVQMQFIYVLLDISRRFHIQLFVTSCSSHILKNIGAKSYFLTSNKFITHDSWVDNAAGLELLGIHKESIIIFCDGDKDKKFLTTILNRMKIKRKNILFYSNTNIRSAIDILKKHFEKVVVIVIHDRELKLESLDVLQLDESNNIDLQPSNIFYWELPCIESYVVANYYLEVDKSIFWNDDVCWLNNEVVWNEFELLYARGIAAIGIKKYYKHILYNPWGSGLEVISKIKSFEFLTKEEIFTVVRVLHGHTLVKKIQQYKNVTYNTMLSSVTDEIVTYPGMDSLKQMIENFQERFMMDRTV